MEAASRYSISVVRDLFLHGTPQHEEVIKKLLKGFYFLHPRIGDELAKEREDLYFVLVCVDFTRGEQVQNMVQVLSAGDAVLGHKLVYASAPDELTHDALLLMQELGVRRVCCGPARDEQLRDHLKRACTERHQVGSLEAYEADIAAAIKRNDTAALRQTLTKLRDLPAGGEDLLRLQAQANLGVNDNKRAEALLKQLLRLNAQNLWAANQLGRLYLRTARVSEGIETLRKLSHFHDLNAQRLAELGEAALLAGELDTASVAYGKGDELTHGKDVRFREGLAKVSLAKHDVSGALELFAARGFSLEIVSYLNMRAILAIREQHFEEGMQFYQHALQGVAKDPLLKAKVLFNMGIAYIRKGDIAAAQKCFVESVTLGSSSFARATGPLELLKQVIKAREKAGLTSSTPATAGEQQAIMGGIEWEPLN